MNDEEVASELNKMVAFIRQEAMEKAREIKVKADEDFNIEKAKIVRAETLAIDAEYAKKRKQAETAVKIAQSTQTNKSRLKLLHAREQHLSELFTNARNQLLELSKDEQKYEDLLKSIIVQGLLSLLEPSATVSARPKDVGLVEKAVQAAQADAGGVRLVSGNRRITIDNTLDERLRLLEDRRHAQFIDPHYLDAPEIRTDLFGKNENRKFYS
ncbi:ATPase V1 A1 complex subunit E [Rhizoctonia solani]|uniref:ATPase V1 A1 complex subunit E n=1 Tax=Rhizoctonia solani TaxID=456999 RepID=A0A8H7I7Z2_9AGAM|nr:ATPase V1 A1 complex subunit E [Rhizoctonia solani]